MLALRRSEQLRPRLFAACHKYFKSQSQLAAVPQVESEYTEQPQYPEILDVSKKAHKKREVMHWHEQIRRVPTVEEKLIKINMPRYYGYKTVMLSDQKLPYNCLPATQHYTRTVFEELQPPTEPTPEQPGSTQLESLVLAAKGDIQDSVEFAFDFFRQKYPDTAELDPQERERLLAQLVVEQINRSLINALGADYSHLHEVEVDYNPRHEAFWQVGGIDPPKNVIKSKEANKYQKDVELEPFPRWMQYIGAPYLTVRHQDQLPTWKNEGESNNLALAQEIPQFKYDPRTLGYSTTHRHGTNIPGFWPGSANGFGCISYQSRAHMLLRPESYGPEDFKEVLHAQAIQSSYAWLLAQANYNGFNTFNELTYPMNTQTIITNGRVWSFYEYQLNTLLVHSDNVNTNPRMNFCRGTDEQQLYQDIDDNGKCVGFNDQIVRQLVQFYLNAPTVQRSSQELQPYLDPRIKCIADHVDEDRRIFLEHTFKHMMSNRPRHLAIPEIYLWEKLYKIDNKTRPMEPKRRYFEVNIDPWKRTMDQHQKEYIPRALRAEGRNSKKKWKKMYYP